MFKFVSVEVNCTIVKLPCEQRFLMSPCKRIRKRDQLKTLTKNSFKRKLKEILLDLLETDNSYINVVAIATKIEN